MQTGGLDWGYKPNIQKSGVIKLGGETVLPALAAAPGSSVAFAAATLNSYNPGGFVTSSNDIRYEATKTNDYVTTYASFGTGVYVGGIGIVNVKLGLGDTRYGSFTDQHTYISTGARHTFSNAEVATLEAGGSVSVDLEVWGGDCFVGPRWFKICDSTYSIVGNSSTAQTTATYLSKWKWFYKPSGGTIINQPIALEASAQYIEVILESDYNAEVMDYDTVVQSTTSNGMPVYNNNSKDSMRVPMSYRYNTNLSQENSQKIFVSDPEFTFKQNDFSARIAYSDIKIYNSSQQGFDVFRVTNIKDLEERYDGITKLSLAGDNLYAIQDTGVIYVPTGARQIEATSGGTLSVASGEVIGRPLVIDSSRGSQHLRGIVETGSVIYIPDAKNKSVYALSGQQLVPITKDNETEFRNVFSTNPDEQYVIGIFDPVKRHYWLMNRDPFVATQYCEIFDEARQMWVANYELPQCQGGVFTNSKLYLAAVVSEAEVGQHNCSIWTMYDGDPSRFFGFNKQARVEFSVNPYPDFTKTFDATMIAASERLSSIEFTVPNEAGFGNQTATTSLDIDTYGNNYRFPNPRGAGSARLRGLYCLTRVNWNNDNQSEINSVNTKFRRSARRPW